MVYQKNITLPAFKKGFHLISEIIYRELDFMPETGLLNIFIQHTSAALSLNENFDPDVRSDLENFVNELIPENHHSYTHTDEGADDMPAHIKSSVFGSSLNIPISNGILNLGTWQGIYLCEFRNHGGRRSLVLTIVS